MNEKNDQGGHESHGGRHDLEPAAPPELSHAVEQAKEAVLKAGDKLTSIWDVTKANGWTQLVEGVDALIAAVRAEANREQMSMREHIAAINLIYLNDRQWRCHRCGTTALCKHHTLLMHAKKLVDQIDSGTQPSKEQADATRRSAAKA